MSRSGHLNSGPEPSRPATLTVDLRESSDAIAITTRQTRGPGLFLLLWEIGWSVGCVFLIGAVIDDPQPGMILFAVPFWAAWLAVACFLIWSFFGTETLLVREDRVLFLRKALITLTAREHPASEVIGFRTCRSRHQENDAWLWGIEVETFGKPIRFGFRIPARERQWLIWQLNHFLGSESGTTEETEQDSDDLPPSRIGSTESLSLTSNDILEQPPTDCSWNMEELADGVRFQRRGRFQPATFLGLLFINAFWNGIVGVFVLSLFGLMPDDAGPKQGAEWWGLFVFLIPFEVIGLIMLIALCATIAEPLRRTVWSLDQHELLTESRWPLFAFTWRWPLDSLHHLQLQKVRLDESKPARFKVSSGFQEETSYQLTFVSHENTDQCSIQPVTEGEARWMAGVLYRYQPRWQRAVSRQTVSEDQDAAD